MATDRFGMTLRSPVLRLLIALLCGGLSATLLYFREEQLMLERSGGPRVPVLITTAELHASERVDPKNVSIQEIPRAYVHVNAIAARDQDKIVGRKVYRAVRQNQPLLWSDFDAPELETALALQKGLRATPLPLGEISHSRFLSPGDYVDVVVHFNLREQGTATVTLMQRVQVLELSGTHAMVALTPEQVESLVFARANGTLTLALRGREDVEQRPLANVTVSKLMKDLNLEPPPPPARIEPPVVRKGKKPL